MTLRAQAEQDLGVILEGDAFGFRWPVQITDPDGRTAGGVTPFYGFSNDIAQMIDPDTGAIITGRLASLTVRLSSLSAAGFPDPPRAIADQSRKPWRVSFDDINGATHTFKVREASPDRGLGVVVCILEEYTP